MSPYASYLLEMLGTLLVVCALAALVLFGARRLGVGRATGGLELLGRLPLDARRSIVLVKVGEKVFVIGTGDGPMTKLGELPAASVPREALEEPRSFGSVLARALTRDVPPKPEPEPAKKEQG
jgi:flagellar protein FliO/FliZ